MSAAESLRLAERVYERLEADDIPGLVDLCAVDVEIVYPAAGQLPYGGEWRGHDGVRAWSDAHEAAEEILDFQVHSMRAADDDVMVVGRFQGRAKPSGRAWETRFIHLLTFTGPRLQRLEAVFDTAAAVEAHGGGAERSPG
jgi:ketosteroid isomerase-like protein